MVFRVENIIDFKTSCLSKKLIGRKCYFGEVVNGQMILSEIGRIAGSEWLKTPEIRPDMNIALDELIPEKR